MNFSDGVTDVMSRAVITSVQELYGRVGFQPPWICYLAFEGERRVGTCGFKSPPHDNRVEIAYYTFPEDEGRGIAIWEWHLGTAS